MIVEWIVGRDWNQFSKILVYTLKFVLSVSVPHRMPSGQDALSLTLCQTSLPRFVLPTRKQHLFGSTSVDFLDSRISNICISGSPDRCFWKSGVPKSNYQNSSEPHFRDARSPSSNYLEFPGAQF